MKRIQFLADSHKSVAHAREKELAGQKERLEAELQEQAHKFEMRLDSELKMQAARFEKKLRSNALAQRKNEEERLKAELEKLTAEKAMLKFFVFFKRPIATEIGCLERPLINHCLSS